MAERRPSLLPAGAAALNFFLVPPIGRFTIADGVRWVALGVYVAISVLRTHVANLRRTIEPAGDDQRHILSDPGVGYRLAP
jgi:hypothetical protein